MMIGITTKPINNRPANNAISLVARCRTGMGLVVVFTEAFRIVSCGWTAIVAYLRLEVKKDPVWGLVLSRSTSSEDGDTHLNARCREQ